MLAAMSGGVDSAVAAAILVEQGHEVVGVTLKLWDNPGEEGCCSVVEMDDARQAARRIGIDHLVFNLMERFEEAVVGPYVSDHRAGRTPNPCVECNRHVKFGQLLARAGQLGFDALATGHHARVGRGPDGRFALRRGADAAKDQSYVLYVLGQPELGRCLFPVGELTKAEVRVRAGALGLGVADKPDSQDVCFVAGAGGREAFLASRASMTPGRLVDGTGGTVGSVAAVELVTVGQRRGLGLGGGDGRRYAISVDVPRATVVVGPAADLLVDQVSLRELVWARDPATGPVVVQSTAHGRAVDATFDGTVVTFAEPQRRVAPGQSVVLYSGDEVLGGGIAT